ncbi:Rossmann-like and DUF2520 domain-containing protein [Carboxylicivirga taeanensis]|uniref:Rossmann-like and DUF2520 domain-containing protein n=1 Tax=Carboxylicivirga taeanensis TaxID=1416875 RepID=UPI003F6DCFCF
MDVVLIGSGNVASHLGKALCQINHTVKQVYSRRLDNARELARQLGAEPIAEMNAMQQTADLYIISVKDDAIAEVIGQMPPVDGLVVHTAGSVSINAVSTFANHGVFYPFQSFIKGAQLSFDTIPILVEANTESNTELLFELGKVLSSSVLKAGSEQRGALHISAVFACNFVNHMYRLGEKVLVGSGLPFELLHPLIKETADKVLRMSPSDAQTGPAVRNDQQIIQKHLHYLSDNREEQDIYRLLSESILKNKV